MPSLNRLSASISVTSRGGALSWRIVATTATGSVAETMAPTMNASTSGQARGIVEDDGDDGGADDHARDRQQRHAAERSPELDRVESIGRLEDEAGEQDGHRDGGRDVEVATRRERRDDQPDHDHRHRVLQAKPARDERDQRHRDEHGDQDQQRDGRLRTDHRRHATRAERRQMGGSATPEEALGARWPRCSPSAGDRSPAGWRRPRRDSFARSAFDPATRCTPGRDGRSRRATSRCSARS